jgi:hypothetical protein
VNDKFGCSRWKATIFSQVKLVLDTPSVSKVKFRVSLFWTFSVQDENTFFTWEDAKKPFKQDLLLPNYFSHMLKKSIIICIVEFSLETIKTRHMNTHILLSFIGLEPMSKLHGLDHESLSVVKMLYSEEFTKELKWEQHNQPKYVPHRLVWAVQYNMPCFGSITTTKNYDKLLI